jgi:hypothetical protein
MNAIEIAEADERNEVKETPDGSDE